MRNHDSNAAKSTQSRDQEIAGLGIEMIGRLIEHQHIGIAPQRGAHLPSLAFARRERRPARDFLGSQRQFAEEATSFPIARRREARDFGRESLDGLGQQDRG